MYSAGSRAGSSKKTPATVQCQKCLKRGHYSYECKATPSERPYVPRPSRTQQLFNPKLLPKLTNQAPDISQKKQGAADEVLAKREAERTRKRELEAEEEPAPRVPSPKRRRSYSPDSVATISTRSPSPARERPTKQRDDRSPRRSRSRDSRESPPPQRCRPSLGSRDHYLSERSESPERGYSDRISPGRGRRDSFSNRSYGKAAQIRRQDSRSRSRSRSPSPTHSPGKDSDREEYRVREDHGRRGGDNPPPRPRQPSPPRERSLSPFSKRLALTQAMNIGR